MKLSEPPRSWQEQQHQRIRRHDPTAFAELCEEALPHLLAFLSLKFASVAGHQQESAAIDALLDYHAQPNRYDPDQISLFAYLRMAADRDLRNALDKERRRTRRLVDVEQPHVQPDLAITQPMSPEAELNDWLAQHTTLSKEEVIAAFLTELNQSDREILELMLGGIRETEAYAAILDIAHTPILEQRQHVKRAKDRLTKKVQRFGARMEA